MQIIFLLSGGETRYPIELKTLFPRVCLDFISISLTLISEHPSVGLFRCSFSYQPEVGGFVNRNCHQSRGYSPPSLESPVPQLVIAAEERMLGARAIIGCPKPIQLMGCRFKRRMWVDDASVELAIRAQALPDREGGNSNPSCFTTRHDIGCP